MTIDMEEMEDSIFYEKNPFRDSQKSRVYKWEDENVSQFDKKIIHIETVPYVIDYVWANEGLLYPPKVVYMRSNNTSAWAKADRYNVHVHPENSIPTWVLLHELSHSLTFNYDSSTDAAHGADFLGMYMRLLNKYVNIEFPYLFYTASKYKLKYNIHARPFFVD